ncbi:hypothetical protein [Streptomyces melanogenes]|uniref:hypothetical protein n=1 Tax=Streptomyces melanogenes TaxID=67326 RepID=UPI00167D02BB|nr:hypothetical protein [Streptomyces melanogenes]GGP86171.1 hypothetical protein GCM10010278_75660 [Streptomyces melanogenes]
MVIRIRLGDHERVTGDPLGRGSVGYFPGMTEAEALEAGRGPWRLDARLVVRERFALVVGEGLVRAVAEIDGVTEHTTGLGRKKSLDAHLLGPGHPLHDGYFNRPDPLVNASHNSVTYGQLPEEEVLSARYCECGCGEKSIHGLLPRHEGHAVQARVRGHFGGSFRSFLTWLDAVLPPAAPVGPPASSASDKQSRSH